MLVRKQTCMEFQCSLFIHIEKMHFLKDSKYSFVCLFEKKRKKEKASTAISLQKNRELLPKKVEQ